VPLEGTGKVLISSHPDAAGMLASAPGHVLRPQEGIVVALND
jgi:hypothetical protein